MRRTMRWNIPLSCMLLAACVTINVYFPAAAAEKAADQIIERVNSGAAAAPATVPEVPSRPQTRNALPSQPLLAQMAGQVLNSLVPAAYAQEAANIDISSPEIRAITASMQARFAQLKAYFDSGAVGYTADGLIETREASAVPLAERALVKRLVAEDNKDRATLYAEIAKANGHPEWEDDIRSVFARRWIARAQAGWYHKSAAGTWTQK